MRRIAAHASAPAALYESLLVILLAVLLFRTYADADLWGHTRFGSDIAAAGSAVLADRYSFTTDRPWVNHEWLSELAMYSAFRAGGATGLILLKVALAASVLLIVFRTLRRAGLSRGVRAALIMVTALGMLPRLAFVRPQLFSLLLFAALLWALAAFDRGHLRRLLFVPPIFFAWVNLHGGWLVGLGVLGLWAAVRTLQRRGRGTLALWATTVSAALATLGNPYGFGMWRFLGTTVGLGRADIADWQPVTRSGPGDVIPWLLVLALALVLAWRLGRRNDPAHLAVVIVLGCGAARIIRLDAFFCLAVVMLLAPRVGNLHRRAGLQQRPAPDPRFAIVNLAAAVVLIVPGGTLVRSDVGCLHMDAPWVPDQQAAAFIRVNELRGHLMTPYDWGEYALWHFGPALRVSMDGRRETLYSDAVVAANRDFYQAAAGGRDYADRVGADYVWAPRGAPIEPYLVDRGWRVIFGDERSTVFARWPAAHYLAPPAAAASRCFPGP